MRNKHVLRHSRLFVAGLAALLAAGCTSSPGAGPAGPSNLKPYLTVTRAVTPAVTITTASTQPPIPTPTPSTYTVVSGDTLTGIAGRFGIRLADLLAANPGVVAEALSVGTVLKIPVSTPGGSGGAESTPVPAELGAVQCTPSGAGLYCFAALHNPYSEALENAALQISLLDGSGKSLASQEAFLPLDILPAGSTLPAYAFFPKASAGAVAVARLVRSMRVMPGDTRYLPALVRNVLVSVDWNGRSAQAQGEIFLPAGAQKNAGTIWLAAVAYGQDGQIVGFRRWEWQGSLAPGNGQAFSFLVYSLGPAIERVDVVVEARP